MQEQKLEDIRFESATHGVLNYLEVLEEIRKFLEEKPLSEYSLVIGTDSHELTGSDLSNRKISLVTAVLVHRKGFGGKYFWTRKNIGNIHSLREKIYAETLISLEFAMQFVPLIKNTFSSEKFNYNLEIHFDVGEHGATREMIKEVVGMVTGNGFIAKTKPYSYGASYVADKHT